MKAKKAMAVILAVATVLSSQSFAANVYADDFSREEIVVEESVETEETIDEENDESISETENEEDEASVNEQAEVSDSEQSESSETEQDEDADKEQTSEELDSVTEEVSEEDDEVLEEENIEEEVASEEEILTEDEEILEEDIESEEDVEENELWLDDEGNVIESAADYFQTDKATLTLKTGAVLAHTVTIPKCVTTIPDDIFKNNSIVKKVVFERDSKLATIEAGAFSNSGIEEIVIPDNVDGASLVIEKNAFKGSKLTNITIKNSKLERIEEGTFESCDISAISLPNVTYVGDNAFSNCVYLEDISIDKLCEIGQSAFEGCSSLNNWTKFPASIEKIGSNAFRSCGFVTVDLTKQTKLACQGLDTDVSKYDDYESAGSKSNMGLAIFANNKKLATVALSDNKEAFSFLPARTFEGCTALKSVTVHNTLKVIGDNAFEGCSALKEIDLNKVQYVNSEAFKNCSALTTVIFRYQDNDSDGQERTHVYIKKDAFPSKSGVTLKAYDSRVRGYANDMNGYSFVSLYTNKINVSAPSEIKPVLSTTNPRPGEKVTVTVPLSSTSYLTNIYITGTGSTLYPQYKGSTDKEVIFEFTMPNVEIVTLTLTAASASQLTNGVLSFAFEGGTEVPTQTGNTYSWSSRGCSSTLKVKNTVTSSAPISNWLYTFASSNENIVTVTADGNVTGIAYGSAEISITPIYNKKDVRKITVSVGGTDVIIGQVYTGQRYQNGMYSPQELISAGASGEVSLDPVTGYPVVTFDKNAVAKSGASFNVDIKAYKFKNESKPEEGFANNKEDNSFIVKSTWVSTDTAIATVSKKTSTDNKNTINIKKGSSGESLITVSTLNKDEKNPNQFNPDFADNIGHIIVRVIDITPRLVETTLTINHQLEDGTPITVVPVYDYEILDDEGLFIAKKKVTNGITSYYKDKDTEKFELVDGNDGHWYILTTDSVTLAMNKTEKYKKNTLYLCGFFKDTNKGEFAIPLPEVTLTNTVPSPKLTQSGSINMFYNGKASLDDLGSVRVTQSLSNYVVENYALVSTQNNKLENSETKEGTQGQSKVDKGGTMVPFDSLNYNFDIKADPDSKNNSVAVITRSRYFDDLATVNKKTVVSGYLYIKYKGYKTPAKVAITVKNTNTAPSYVLNMTSATAHVGEINQSYKLWLYKKGTVAKEENRINLSKTHDTENVYVNFDVTSTKGNFLLSSLQSRDMLNEGYLQLALPQGGTPVAGKSVIKLHMITWSDPNKYLSYTFTMNTTDKLTAKLSKPSVSLNKAWVGADATNIQKIEVRASNNDAYIDSFTNLVPAKNNQAHNTLKGLISFEGGTAYNNEKKPALIKIRQPQSSDEANAIPTGTYSFTVVPNGKFNNNTSQSGIALAKVTFKISVVNKAPALSLGAFSFNSNAKVVSERTSSSCKMSNLIVDTDKKDYSLDYTNAKVTENFGDKKVYTWNEFDGNVASFVADFEYDRALSSKKASYKAGKYTVEGVVAKAPSDGAEADVSKFVIELKNNATAPSVIVKTSGSINMIRPYDTIVINSTLKNVNGNITGVSIKEIDPNNKSYVDSRFKITTNSGINKTTAYLSVDENWTGEEMIPNKEYEVALCYSISSMNNAGTDVDETTADCITRVKVKPTVKFPTITVNSSKTYAYAGQNKNNAFWYIDVTATVDKNFRGFKDVNGDTKYTPGTDKPYINVAGIDWSASMSKAIKSEFEIIKDINGDVIYDYNPVSGEITFSFRLKNAAEQLQNKKYTLKFTPLFKELQVKDPVKGSDFSLVVTVNK